MNFFLGVIRYVLTMPKKPKPAGRAVFRIEVTTGTIKTIDGLTENLGITQIAIASKLIEWFAKQPDIIQQAIIGLYPEDVHQSTAELVIRGMAKQAAPRDRN